MEQLAIVARLKSGAEQRAAELVVKGPPFEPEATGLDRHAVYLSAGEVVFVFEGREVEWIVEQLVDDPIAVARRRCARASGGHSWKENRGSLARRTPGRVSR